MNPLFDCTFPAAVVADAVRALKRQNPSGVLSQAVERPSDSDRGEEPCLT